MILDDNVSLFADAILPALETIAQKIDFTFRTHTEDIANPRPLMGRDGQILQRPFPHSLRASAVQYNDGMFDALCLK